jgi:Stabilization of polarity axis/Docking domain of Afi1 for Arf3 in vesicle trafficking
MEHQYPGAISPDENMLAELMLPDQTHMRQQDWTMFFLHKDSVANDEDEAEKEARKQARRERKIAREAALLEGRQPEDLEEEEEEDSSDDEDDEGDSAPLMYVLNLVNTKQDSSVKRGAIVKAMAICTRHSFLHIYKPLLLLALEDYMKTPTPDTLELLYNALNSMDASLIPRLSRQERHILQASDTSNMFVEKFEQMIVQRLQDEATGRIEVPSDSPAKANGSTQYAVPRDTHEYESKIIYNGAPIPVKIPTALSPETVGDFSLIKLIQTFSGPHQSQPQPFALHPHLTTTGAYTHPIIVLINAMLTQKRVIFLGHNRPSGEVAEAVVAACALASGGVLRGFTRHAFPYTDLTKVDELLKVPGFIAGVTNPAFSYHPEWWDLLCDLPSGRIKISSSIEPAPVTEGTISFQQGHSILSSLGKETMLAPTGDAEFMEDIQRSIAQRHGESLVRAKFRAYITKFTRIAAAFEETVYGASNLTVIPPTEVVKGDGSSSSQSSQPSRPQSLRTMGRNLKGHGYVWPSEEAKTRELAASAARIEGWRSTRSYYTFISDLATHTRNPTSPKSPVSMKDMLSSPAAKPYLDIHHSLSKLRTLRLTPNEAGAIYLALEAYCNDYESILELLELTPMSEAGLFHVSLGLWHEDARVREAATTLLDRLRNHAAGKVFFARLGGWASMGFTRGLQETEARSQAPGDDSEDVLAPLSVNGEIMKSRRS